MIEYSAGKESPTCGTILRRILLQRIFGQRISSNLQNTQPGAAIMKDDGRQGLPFQSVIFKPPGNGEWQIEISRDSLIKGSGYFESMFSENWKQAVNNFPRDADTNSLVISVEDVDRRCVEAAKRFLETEDAQISSVSVGLGTLYFALRYSMTSLCQHCVQYLSKSELLDNSTVIHILDVVLRCCPHSKFLATLPLDLQPSAPPADDQNENCPLIGAHNFARAEGLQLKELKRMCDGLVEKCVKFVEGNTVNVMRGDIWEEASVETVELLLGIDRTTAPNELFFFEAAVSWATYWCKEKNVEITPHNLRDLLPNEVLFSVRFLTMNRDDFIKAAQQVEFSVAESSFIVDTILRKQQNVEMPSQLVPRLSRMISPRIFVSTNPCEFVQIMEPKGRDEISDETKRMLKKNKNKKPGKCLTCVVECLAFFFE
ncbi:unnamed protein product [Notodromas monacha]|uniref:Uncharacterized protein n=1 Tax=Notodromas monacha TaxID=399045 RepID=A0A7R9BXK2_9CRUS|nr:unnamed protein product [Notodromas monacha]CAG0922658.1 unnamed protein product [Notodromas monacha]